MSKIRKAQSDAARRQVPVPGPPPQTGNIMPSPMVPIAGTEFDPSVIRRVNAEIGLTGLRYWYGRLDEEFLQDLKWPRNIQIYKEMGDNDATIGALFNAITLLCRSVKWRVQGDQAHDDRVEFIDSCRDDMSHSWDDFVASIMRGMLQYGWQFHEIVYKYRQKGESQYTDGKIGWKKLPVRSQDSFFRWEFAPDGSLLAITQLPPPIYRFFTIPMEKGLLFRTENIKGSPEGRSILRPAYRAWYMMKNLENIEAIGIERRLNGLPCIYAPARLFNSSNPQDVATLDALKNIATNIKIDEQAGIVMPQAYDENKNPLFKVELLSGGDSSTLNTSEIIDRYAVRILMLVVADFLHLGHGSSGRGSYALAQTKTGMFGQAIGVFLDQVSSVMNRYAIPRLLEINGMDTADPPQMVHGDVDTRDIKELGDSLQALAAAGMPIFPNPKIQARVLEILELPTPTPEEQEEQEQEYEAQQQAAQDAGLDGIPAPAAAEPNGQPNGKPVNRLAATGAQSKLTPEKP